MFPTGRNGNNVLQGLDFILQALLSHQTGGQLWSGNRGCGRGILQEKPGKTLL